MAAESHITIPLETLLDLLRAEGFKEISTTAILDIQKVLANLDEEEINDYKNSAVSIKSITVYAEKPSKDNRNCCGPESKCC